MKTILAFGDSITFGHDAANQRRHEYADRWPGALEAALGGQVRVIAEGLGGRTTAFDDPTAGADRNGARILPTLLESHKPLDLVIIMLGTNDLKPAIHGAALTASYGVRRLIQIVRGHFVQPGDVMPQIIVVSPPLINGTANVEFNEMFEGGTEQSRLFARHYKNRADEYGVGFFDAAKVASPDPVDGVHLDAANTRAIGQGLVPLVKQVLGL